MRSHRDTNAAYRQRRYARGEIQVTEWVPEEDKARYKAVAAELRATWLAAKAQEEARGADEAA